MKEMGGKTIVVGPKNFSDYAFLSNILSEFGITTLIAGMDTNAETMAVQYAIMNDIDILTILDSFYLNSSIEREYIIEDMIKNSHVLIAFWDGEINEVEKFIKYARLNGLVVRIYKI